MLKQLTIVLTRQIAEGQQGPINHQMREIAGGLLTLAYTTGEYGFCRHAVQLNHSHYQ